MLINNYQDIINTLDADLGISQFINRHKDTIESNILDSSKNSQFGINQLFHLSSSIILNGTSDHCFRMTKSLIEKISFVDSYDMVMTVVVLMYILKIMESKYSEEINLIRKELSSSQWQLHQSSLDKLLGL